MAVFRVRRSRPDKCREEQKTSPLSMVRYTREASPMCFNVVLNQKKGKKFSGISIKENVVIMPRQELWLLRHSGMDSIGQVLCKKLKIWSRSAMVARDT